MPGLGHLLAWLSPILSTIIITIATAHINAKISEGERKRDEAREETAEKRRAEAEWRESVDAKLSEIEGKVDRSISAQAAQTRSDIVHKCHRYLDDLGKASIEEKQALHDEHVQYSQFCDDLGIDNNFIDDLVQRVMELPERDLRPLTTTDQACFNPR